MDPLTGGKTKPSARDEVDQAHRQAEMEEEAEARRADASEGLAARKSITDRTADGEEGEELFPLGTLPGDELTPEKIIKKGLKKTLSVALSKAAVPVSGGGLFDPDKRGRCLVHYLPGAVHEVPERNGDEQRVTSWKIVQDLRVVFVEHANEEAPLIKAEFENLLALDPESAGKVLDELKALFVEAQSGEAAAA